MVFPEGYFSRQSLTGIMTLATQMGIGYCEMLYLREKIGRDLMNVLLQAHGMLGHGTAKHYSRMEPSHRCPGVPASGPYPAAPCQQGDDCGSIILIGARDRTREFSGIMVCRPCQRNIQPRELALLQATNKPSERRTVLEKQAADHRERNRRESGERLENNRTINKRLKDTFEEDPSARAKYNEKKRRQKAARPKVKGTARRGDRKIQLYPPFFQALLTKAAGILLEACGQESVYWIHIVALFNSLLYYEQDQLRKHGFNIRFNDQAQPIGYLVHAFEQGVRDLLQPIYAESIQKGGSVVMKKTFNWKVKDYEKLDSSRAVFLKKESLVDYVLMQFYGEDAEGKMG
jgi:hypothetical protein